MTKLQALLVVALFAGIALSPAQAQRWRETRPPRGDAAHAEAPALPPGSRVLRDIAYGDDAQQRLDVYLPARARHAPVIVMVHGGAWAFGDKNYPGLIAPKAAHWLPRGYALVSVDYRLLPAATPLQQAQDVARALATVQRRAAGWGLDRDRIVLMGHSAGAHLATLLDVSPELLAQAGAMPPRATVSLDSAAMDVVQLMRMPRHPKLYDRAFGGDRRDWVAASPYHRLARGAPPVLAVCSSRRPDACPQARALSAKAATLGVRVQVLPQDLSHMQINRELGAPSAYTDAVTAFIDGALR